jgi:uncharacterized protein (DUF1330 family)
MPKGYWIAHITVSDMDVYQAYRNAIPDILKQFGGKFIIRAGVQTVTEGEVRPPLRGNRVPVLSSCCRLL